MKVFIFDPLWNELITNELEHRLNESGLEMIVTSEIAPLTDCKALFEGDEERMLYVNPDYVRDGLKSEDYKDIPNLVAILGGATSFSWIDLEYANMKNIPVCNIRNFSTEAAAEWAIMMMLNVARQIPRLIKDGFPLDYGEDFIKYRGIELKRKRGGIVGLGNLGSAIAQRLEGLGMEVVYWSNSPKEDTYTRMELSELFKTADVIFPTLASKEETRSIITDELLLSMKPSAMLIGVVSKLYDEQVVLDMIKRGDLYGFGYIGKPASFDVYEGNVWAAPSYAWDTDGSLNNSMVKLVDNMVWAGKGEFPMRVN